MDFDINKASKKLSQLDLKFSKGSFDIEMYWIRVMSVDGDWNIARHTHSSYEFHFVADGMSVVKMDTYEFTVNKGEFYITKPGEYHEQINVNGNRYVEYSMNCKISLNSEHDIEEAMIYKYLNDDKCQGYNDSNDIINLFEKVLSYAYYEKIGYYNQIQLIILLIIISSVQVMSKNMDYDYEVPHKHKKDDYRFSQITQYIHDNIGNKIITKNIADYIYLSEKQVNRIIKKKTNLSTKQYINKIKLNKAKDLLKNTDLLIKEISEKLGFSSEYYFSQFFKREEGYPPGMFRINTMNF
ncbi:hypothetical protein SH1V18_18820 [Vallitalea longa]|uniref:HTH araC/xylS-type domain-containing protein n=1 Tax=Vallitalea longa TaxID=2936439 RepID=A0A9W6DFE5_9FIRM|nr:AraC family transcriptional regulator [Vallitalea longa]GKX29402.1 hypothetical protein SH1V18_18820 [Vallitalea longa]